jgi:hypothetical protein
MNIRSAMMSSISSRRRGFIDWRTTVKACTVRLISSSLLFSSIIGSPSNAQFASRPISVFSCNVGTKRLAVTAVGAQLIYSFGPVGRPEIQIIGSASNGNLFWQSDLYSRYASYDQIRFTSARYSYVVYDLIPTSDGSGPIASGVLVWRGRTKVAEFQCREQATINALVVNRMNLPEDTGQWFY